MEQAMQEGLELEDASSGAHEKSKIVSMSFAPFEKYEIRSIGKSFTKLRVIISGGEKTENFDDFFGHFDAQVLDLKRVAFGGIELKQPSNQQNKIFYSTRVR